MFYMPKLSGKIQPYEIGALRARRKTDPIAAAQPVGNIGVSVDSKTQAPPTPATAHVRTVKA